MAVTTVAVRNRISIPVAASSAIQELRQQLATAQLDDNIREAGFVGTEEEQERLNSAIHATDSACWLMPTGGAVVDTNRLRTTNQCQVVVTTFDINLERAYQTHEAIRATIATFLDARGTAMVTSTMHVGELTVSQYIPLNPIRNRLEASESYEVTRKEGMTYNSVMSAAGGLNNGEAIATYHPKQGENQVTSIAVRRDGVLFLLKGVYNPRQQSADCRKVSFPMNPAPRPAIRAVRDCSMFSFDWD